MATQLKRTLNNITYYCELISSDYWKCLERKKMIKEYGGKARILPVAGGWGVFKA